MEDEIITGIDGDDSTNTGDLKAGKQGTILLSPAQGAIYYPDALCMTE